MKYPYLLFDADDTLFDFQKGAVRAFEIMCRTHNIPHTPENYQLYHEINKVLWAAFDRGEVSKEFVTLERYIRFLKTLRLDRNPAQCNHTYLTALGKDVDVMFYVLLFVGFLFTVMGNYLPKVTQNRTFGMKLKIIA